MKKPVALLFACCTLAGCASTGPGAAVRWTSYPALASTTTPYNWLVVKCQVSDVPTIPAGLDLNIQQFMGIGGANYGNIVDYFHDVSYNRASVLSTTFVGWVKAPFSKANLASGPLASAVPGRQNRVVACLNAIPNDQAPDLDDFYGVVVVNNAVQDGGACYVGQKDLVIKGKTHKLACLWFDPNSLKTEFAAHEYAHGLGMTHSYNDIGSLCDGAPGEYCDPWDIMSAQRTYQFVDRNFLTAGGPSGGGPGVDAANLIDRGWLPSDNQRRFQFEGDAEQIFTIRALSRPRAGAAMAVIVETGDPRPFEGIFTVEYRQGEGWDRGFATDLSTPSKVRESGGVVLVHQYRPVGAPTSTLVTGPFGGAMQPCDTLVLGNGARYVTVKDFDTAEGTATVAIGFGRGKRQLCFRNILTKVYEPRGVHPALPIEIAPSKQAPAQGPVR
jgi:M6 family metalloprotease-like protein